MNSIKLILTLLIVGLFWNANAQLEPIYTQYHFNQYLINPAFGGLYENAAISFNSRAQWYGLDGAPFTNTLTLESSIGDHAGMGFRVMHDQIGISNQTEVMASASYYIKSHFMKIGMGLQGGVSTVSNNINELDQKVFNDPNLSNIPPTSTRPNFGVGIVIHRFDYFLALSIPRILDNGGAIVEDDPRNERHIYLSTGCRFTLFRSKDTKLQTLMRVVGDRISFDLAGTYFITDFLWAGAMLRDYHGVSFFGKLKLDNHFSVGYSFELPTNNLIFTNYGTHEVTLSYIFKPFKSHQSQERFF